MKEMSKEPVVRVAPSRPSNALILTASPGWQSLLFDLPLLLLLPVEYHVVLL